jgi:hypothetical protein
MMKICYLYINNFLPFSISGWHTRINGDIGKANVSFYILVPALQRESRVIELTYRLVSEQQILRDQRNRYRDLEGRLHALWDSYDHEQISASQLLRECGQIYGPPSDYINIRHL